MFNLTLLKILITFLHKLIYISNEISNNCLEARLISLRKALLKQLQVQ